MRRLRLARRELDSLSREKTIVLALLIQLFVAAFSSFLVVGLSSLYDPSSVEGADVRVAVAGNASDAVLAAADAQEGVEAIQYGSEREALRAFRRNEVDAALLAAREGHRIAVELTVPRDSLRKTLVVVQLRETLEAMERRERRDRAEYLRRQLAPVPPEVGASPYFAFSYTVLLPLLVFLPVFISGSTAVDAVTEEVERGTLELLRVTPLSLRDVVDGKALAMTVLAPVQVALWLALLWLNGIEIAHAPLLVALGGALALGLVAFGVGLGLVVPNRQRAQLLYSVGVLVVFTATALLPEHPATTVALLAIDSATLTTYASVAGYAAAAVGVAAGVRRFAGRVDAESL